MVLPLKQSISGGSGSFLVAADDGNQYWCKAPNNPQSPRVPVNEQIVGRLGALIGVAVCEVALVYVPTAIGGWEFRPGLALQQGWIHGSRPVDGSVEVHSLDHRSQDDNAVRHAGYFALHDWLFGGDSQWLVDGDHDSAYFSHDHGHYFPNGPDWTVDDLNRTQGEVHEPGWVANELSTAEIDRLADALEGVDSNGVLEVLSRIPRDWPISDDEIRALADWAAHRAPGAAQRLRQHR